VRFPITNAIGCIGFSFVGFLACDMKIIRPIA
jgi:hypothetical protein